MLEEGLALLEGHQRIPLVAGHGLIRHDAHSQLAQAGGFLDELDMAAVEHIGGEAHIDSAVLYFLQLAGDYSQVVGIVYLAAEHVLHIQGQEVHLPRHLIQSILRIALDFARLAERYDLVQPYFPVSCRELVHGLGGHGVLEELNANLCHLAVSDDGLEILLRKICRGACCHDTALSRDQTVKDTVLKDHISMHEQQVSVLQIIFGLEDGVDVVGLLEPVVVDESDLEGQGKALHILHQHIVKGSRGDDHFLDARKNQLMQLAAQDGLPAGNLRHALGLPGRECTHAAAHTGIENQCFHFVNILHHASKIFATTSSGVRVPSFVTLTSGCLGNSSFKSIPTTSLTEPFWTLV